MIWGDFFLFFDPGIGKRSLAPVILWLLSHLSSKSKDFPVKIHGFPFCLRRVYKTGPVGITGSVAMLGDDFSSKALFP